MSKKQNDTDSILLLLAVLAVILLAVLAFGISLAKFYRRYSRSYLLAASWLVFYLGFLLLGYNMSEGSGDSFRTGFEVMSSRYLGGESPLWLLGGVIVWFTIVTLVIGSFLKPEEKEAIMAEIELERVSRPRGGRLVANLIAYSGLGFLGALAGYKAGYRAGKGLV